MNFKTEDLIIAVDKAVEVNAKYFGVAILNEQNGQVEVITNTVDNMMNGKLDYYKEAYNEDLQLKYNNHIRIKGFTIADSADDIFNNLGY